LVTGYHHLLTQVAEALSLRESNVLRATLHPALKAPWITQSRIARFLSQVQPKMGTRWSESHHTQLQKGTARTK